MGAIIRELGVCRWKVFQVLPLEGENIGPNALRRVGCACHLGAV
jgi:hypothetical protein